MPDPVPYFMIKPLIHIGDVATGVDIQCAANNVETNVDQDETTAETFCGSWTNYKTPKWTIVITVLQSFGADGIWGKLQPMMGTLQDFVIQADADAAPSIDNPVMSGTARVKFFPFLSGAVGEASDFDIELAVQGAPVFGIVAPTGASAPPAGEPAEATAA